MSSTMRDWIASTAEREFSKAFDAFALDKKPGQRGGYVCSSERVTVHLKKGKQIQVIDFNGQSQPAVDVTVSDGTTSIRATFTSPSTEEFERKNNRKFTDKIRGAILAITDYHLIYQPNAIPGKRVTLKVSQFKLRGSEGSGVFGRPSNIEESNGIHHVISKIDGLLFGAENNDIEQPESETDILSQPGDLEERESRSPTTFRTQAAFATQLPPKAAERSFQSKSNNPPSINKGADLMAILTSFSIPTVPETLRDRRSTGDVAMEGTRKASKDVQKLSVLQPVSNGRKVEISSKLGAKANEQLSQSSISSSNSKNRPLRAEEPNLSVSSNPIPNDDSEKENSQESLRRERHSVAVPEIQKIELVAGVESEISTFLIDKTPDKNPFEGFKRVPRSYVRVPQDQQKILDQTDSWYEPGAGSRLSYANIPPDVLRDLNSFIDRKPAQRRGRKNGVSAAQINEDQESEDDEEDASEEGDDDEEIAEDPGNDVGEEESDSYSTRRTGVHKRGSINHDQSAAAKMLQQTTYSSQNIQARNDCKRSEGTESEGEFVGSWSASPNLDANQHHDLEPDELEIAPLSTLRNLDTNSRKSSASMVTNMAAHKSSSPPREAIAQPPSLANISGPVNRHPAIDFNFPSSSPGDEEELELVVPHAIDDEVLDCPVEVLEEPKTSQELPSMASKNRAVVQVEHTPNQYQQNAQGFEDGRQHDTKQVNRALKGLKREHEAISSDLIIPGTFRDTSSQDCPLVPAPVVGEHQKSQPMDPHALDMHSLIAENANGGEIAHGKLSMELDFSQHEKEAIINSSPPKYPSLIFEASSTTQRPTTPQKDEMPASNQEAATDFSPSPIDTLSSTRRSAYRDATPGDSSPLNPSSLKRGGESVQLDAQKLKRRRLIKPEDLNLSQEEVVARNTSEMARNNRHKFMGRISETIADPPMVQIAQSQPKSPAATLPSQDRPSTEDVSPQSVTDFVRSSVPEKVEAAEHTEVIHAAENRNGLETADSRNLKRKAGEQRYEEALEIISIASDSGNEAETQTPEDVAPKPSHPPTAFDEFTAVYPTYGGTMKRFVEALVYIEWLLETKGENFLRASLWDDFIRSLFHEYLDYVRQAGEKAKTGFSYFNMLDKPPVFQDRVITPDNLQDALWTHGIEQVENLRSRFRKSASTQTRHTRLEPSHELPSLASQQLQKSLSNDDVVESESINRTRDTMDAVSQDPNKIPAKRPFFETPSQVQASKGKETSRTSVEARLDIEIPRSSESTTRRGLPWVQNGPDKARPSSSPNVRDSATVASSQTPMAKRKRTEHLEANSPFQGSPASPILGNPNVLLISRPLIRPKQTPRRPLARSSSRSPKTGTVPPTSSSRSHDHNIPRKPSIPVSKPSLRQGESSTPINDKDKVDGCLDGKKSVATPVSSLPPIKKTSGLGSGPVSSSSSRVGKRPTTAPTASPTVSGVCKKISFEDFIRRRLSSRSSSNASTPSSNSGRRMPGKGEEVERELVRPTTAEPETQEWTF